MKLKAVPLSGPQARAAFSLIELLVVIAIIAILASLLLTTSGYIQEKAGNARAQAEIKALESAIENYKQDYGSYPEAAQGSDDQSTEVLLDALNPTTKGAKIYFEIPAKMLDSYRTTISAKDMRDSAKQLVDPFGNPYHYQYPGKDDRSGVAFFDLWSYGKKGSSNANLPATWIKNW